MNLLKTSDVGYDRRLNILVAISATVAILMLIGGLIAVPKILATDQTTEQINQANTIQACRALFRVEVDDANADLQAARAELDVLTNQGFEAVVRRDQEAFQQVAPEYPQARATVTAAVAALRAATAEYKRQVKLSGSKDMGDKQAFLDACRRQ